jgi:hypothetical protein
VRVTLRVALYSQSVHLGENPSRLTTSDFFYSNLKIVVTVSDERMGLSFTTAADPRQRSHSQVRFSRDS